VQRERKTNKATKNKEKKKESGNEKLLACHSVKNEAFVQGEILGDRV
jgi:hypothetical protein